MCQDARNLIISTFGVDRYIACVNCTPADYACVALAEINASSYARGSRRWKMRCDDNDIAITSAVTSPFLVCGANTFVNVTKFLGNTRDRRPRLLN